MTRKQNKTKRVGGVGGIDLESRSFAYVGDEQDIDTWKLPIYFPRDEAATRNHIKNALERFGQTGGIPECQRASVFLILCGAARAHGIPVRLTQKQYDELHQQWQAAQKL
jgi:hypothetical protein